MSVPRQVLPGRFYLITRRTFHGHYFLRVDDETNGIFGYCLAEAAARFRLTVVLTMMLSNHHHTIVYDPDGTIIQFVEHFHKMVAKSMNALRGRPDCFWSGSPPSIVELLDDGALIDKLIYVATNPVKHKLVEKVHHWPGFNGVNALFKQQPIVLRRPAYFDPEGPMPESVTLTFTTPDDVDKAALLRALRTGILAVEEDFARKRRATGQRVLGRRRVLRQPWNSAPDKPAPMFEMRPRVAASNRMTRNKGIERNRVFAREHRIARLAWLAGAPIPFPNGTYALRRFLGVPIVSDFV
jgi:putative transposase